VTLSLLRSIPKQCTQASQSRSAPSRSVRTHLMARFFLHITAFIRVMQIYHWSKRSSASNVLAPHRLRSDKTELRVPAPTNGVYGFYLSTHLLDDGASQEPQATPKSGRREPDFGCHTVPLACWIKHISSCPPKYTQS